MTITGVPLPALGPDADLGDASDLLAAAAALGMPVPAPAGTRVFEAALYDSDGRQRNVGIYTSEAAAKEALVVAAITAWRYSTVGYAKRPWSAAEHARLTAALGPAAANQNRIDIYQRLRNDEVRLINEWMATLPDDADTALAALQHSRPNMFTHRWTVTERTVLAGASSDTYYLDLLR